MVCRLPSHIQVVNSCRSLALVASVLGLTGSLLAQATYPSATTPWQPNSPVNTAPANNTWNQPNPGSGAPGAAWDPRSAMDPVGWAMNQPNANTRPSPDQVRWYVNNHPDLKTLDPSFKEVLVYSGQGSNLLSGSYLPNGRPNPFTQPNWYLPTTWPATGVNWHNIQSTGFMSPAPTNTYNPSSFNTTYRPTSASYKLPQTAYRPTNGPVAPFRPADPSQRSSQVPIESHVQMSLDPSRVSVTPISDIGKAVLDAERTLSLRETANDKVAQAIGHAELAALYVENDKLDLAFEHTATAERMANEINDPRLKADVLIRTAAVYMSSGEFEQALLKYRVAIPILRAIADVKGQADAFAAVGWAYESLGKPKNALECYESALTLFHNLLDQDGEIRIRIGEGSIYQSIGDFKLAFEEYEKAFPAASKEQQARILSREGEIYLSQGKQYVALERYQRALQLIEAGTDPTLQGTILAGLGRSYAIVDPFYFYSKALDVFEQARGRMESAGNRQGEAGVIASVGELHYRAAIALPFDPFARSCPKHQACPRNATTDFTIALKKYNLALSLMRDAGDRAGEVGVLTNIGLVFDAQGKYQEALENYQKALQLMDQLQDAARIEEFRIDIADQAAGLYSRAILLNVILGHPEDAFNLSERARARAFLDELGNARVDGRLPKDFVAHEESWKKANISLERRIRQELSKPGPQVDQDEISSLESQRTKIQQQYLQRVNALKLSNPDSAELVSVSPLTLRDIQQQLDPDITAISYFTTPYLTLAFVLTRDSFHVSQLPITQSKLGWMIATLLDFAGESGVPTGLKSLHRYLIDPIKSQLKTDKLAIIPHGLLHQVPFAALTPDGQKYLSDEHAVFSLPSLSVLPYIRARRKQSADQALVLANDQEVGLARLNRAYDEAREIASLFHTEPVLGNAATVAKFQEIAGDYGIIHLIAHIDQDTSNPEISRILLGPGQTEDGALDTTQIAGLDLRNTSLVVLSGCQSQSGRLTRGDEIVGLSRAFMYAGASAVIASLWSVDDDATRALMTSFYSHLRQGLPQAEALRSAQIEVREEFPHPFYWAGFVLTGDPGPMSSPSSTPNRSR
jgi:CHAT domain-containing protein/Tfp pilus assembly protein PilF